MNDDLKKRRGMRGAAWACGFAMLSSFATFGCGDENSGSGGSGASGGAGGSGGSGGAGGGAPVDCLDASSYADLFTVKDAGFCVVALYEADELSYSAAWGRHGGPVFVDKGPTEGSIVLTRLTPPSGATGKLASTKTTIDAMLPPMAYVGAPIDLPFFDWTAISYTDMNALGELVLVNGSGVSTRYPVNGFYSGVGIAGPSGLGRLLYMGTSMIGDAATKTNGLYAADACGTAGNMPRLLPDGDATCAAPTAVALSGDYSGPVAADKQGNVFAVPSTPTEQEALGFVPDKVKPGAGMATGDSLFKMSGYAGTLAAITPDASGLGVLAFQPSDGATYEWLDVIAQRYRVDAGKIVPEGVPGPFLTLATPNTQLPFFTDDQDRIWVTPARSTGGYAVAVLSRAP